VRFRACLLALALVVGDAGSAEPASAPTREQVNAEVEKLRADPDLSGVHKQKTLRFKKDEDKKKKAEPTACPTGCATLRAG
jgi:hypothetical protein